MQIKFARTFPVKHYRKGEPTMFIEKLILSLLFIGEISMSKAAEVSRDLCLMEDMRNINSLRGVDMDQKHHTIREGHRFKAGDKFMPQFWSGRPYWSSPVNVLPFDMTVAKTFNFKMGSWGFQIDDTTYNADGDGAIEPQMELLSLIGKNDGLDRHDLLEWFQFPQAFDGQIICWNPEINY